MLYGKPVLIERGSFRPVTNVTLDMLARAQQQCEATARAGEPPVVLMEMTLNNLSRRRPSIIRIFSTASICWARSAKP